MEGKLGVKVCRREILMEQSREKWQERRCGGEKE